MSKDKSKFKLGEFISANRMPVILIIIIAVFFSLMFWLSNQNKIDLSKVDTKKIIPASEQSGGIGDHVYDNTSHNSKVTLIEYGDFQCPSCATVSPKILSLAKEYGKKITIIFRNYPINGHQNALSASAAVEAAGLQGKYWEMHDLLYDKQDEWTVSTASERMEYFTEYAKELYKKYAQKAGVANIDKLISDMQSSNISKKINFDKALGAKDKITGTPSFFLNGKELDSSVWGDDQALRKKIDEALN